MRDPSGPHVAVAEIFRAEAGQLRAALVRVLGDFDLVEDIVSDAILVALERWPVDGVPRRPGAWLMTVARRRGLDLLRRESRYQEKLHATRAELLRVSGRLSEAREADERALELAGNVAERVLLEQRLC